MKLSLSKDLTPLKAAAVQSINNQAEAFRQKFITPGSAQAMIYEEKQTELAKYEADVAAGKTITDTDYPYLKIEADLFGVDIAAAATYVSTYTNEWIDLAPKTEAIRRAALVAVDAAKTPAAIDAATQLDWSSIPNTTTPSNP